ncbi:cytochrome C [Arcobacter vandammei]|uniref:cytochrome C n=1 Tax=Arcobacter vandammei TaxID=2782243 RepID=UPI0018E01912|nr:cytochrome C [Arcobacter vandammei]
MKVLKILAASTLALGLASTSLMADVTKGQKLFIKMLKEPCGMDGAKFALKHTQAEWKQIKADGKGEAEIMAICPKVQAGELKDTHIEHILDFSIEFASDSGNVPSC